MRQMTKKQIDWLARDLVFMWGCLVPHSGYVDGCQANHCEEAAINMGVLWDEATEARVIKRCEELLPALERRYSRQEWFGN